VRAIAALAPGRISPRVPAASSVLELPAGTLARSGLAEGARLDIEGGPVVRARVRLHGVASAAGNLLLAVLYGVFVRNHLVMGAKTGRWAVMLPMVALESLMMVLFLTRRRSIATSSRPLDWIVGVAGSFLLLFLRPTDPLGPLAWLGEPVQVIGLVIAVLATSALGRSIGLVAANRGIQSDGLYRFVRHPLYSGYVLCNLGYVASFPSPRNFGLVAVALIAFYVRAVVEERFLARDPAYREYMQRVRARFVPFVG
jgi:protein-S-isoprenylcysteine O-methyltransferase Ste14